MPDSDTPICKCNVLWNFARDPEHPVVFDEEMGEFHIKHGNGHSMMYYCFFCGGKVPSESKRSSFFAEPTDSERIRLMALTKDLKTVSDVIQAFGEPDSDFPVGEGFTSPAKEGEPEVTSYYRNLVY